MKYSTVGKSGWNSSGLRQHSEMAQPGIYVLVLKFHGNHFGTLQARRSVSSNARAVPDRRTENNSESSTL